MELRYKTPADDAMAISDIFEQSWKFAYKGLISQDYLDSIPRGRWAGRQDYPGWNTLLLTDGDRPVGICTFGRSRFSVMFPGYGEVYACYLIPDYIGKGNGRRLLGAALDRLKEKGFKDVFLFVLKGNEKAIRFYEKMGLVNTGKILNGKIGGQDVEELRYSIHFE